MLTPAFAYVHTVKIEKYLGRGISSDEYGKPVTVKGRVNLKRRYAYSGGGGATTVVTSNGTVFLPTGTDVDEKDRLTFNDKTYSVVGCLQAFDIHGNINHIEVDIL